MGTADWWAKSKPELRTNFCEFYSVLQLFLNASFRSLRVYVCDAEIFLRSEKAERGGL